MTPRCLICGRFYRESGPEPTVCPDHIYDWNNMPEHERSFLIRQAIYRPEVRP